MKLQNGTTKYQKAAIAALLSMITFSCQPALALDDVFDCDFFTGHCTGGGPFDEPDPDSGPEFPDPDEPGSPPPPPVTVPPPPPSPPQPSSNSDGPPPVCEVKPSLPQCN